MYKHYLRLCGCIMILLCGSACGLPGPPLGAQPTAIQIQTITAAHRPYRVIQICIDTPLLYPADLFVKAANKVAAWIDADVTVNQDGFLLYAGEIRGKSFQVNVVPPINVPAIPADQKEPTPRPGYTPQPDENGYHASDMQATITTSNEQAHNDWQKQVTQNHDTLNAVKAEVSKQTNVLRHLDPNVDVGSHSADVFGCLADASQHFQGTQGIHYIIIASPFINNTSVDVDPNLKLNKVHVIGIYRNCDNAPACAERDTQWKSTLTHLGATDVTFYDPLQSEGLTQPLF